MMKPLLCSILVLCLAPSSSRAQNPSRFIQQPALPDPVADAMPQQSIRVGVEQGITAAQVQRDQASATEILTRTPKSGWEAYLQFRSGQEPGERRWANGSKNWYVRPWNAAERVQRTAQYRQEYAAFPAPERARWEGKVSNADLGVNAPSQTPPARILPVRQAEASTPTAEQNQAEMARKYPALGVAGSPLNREFVARYQQRRQSDPGFFNATDWPVRLTEEALNALASGKK